MKVQEIMTQPVASCRPNDGLQTAAQSMWENDVGALPVVGDEGNLVGFITDRDVCMSAYTKGQPLCDLSVADAMAKKVIACKPQDSLALAVRMMRSNQIRRLPVVDDVETLQGILSVNDVARLAELRQTDGMARELTGTLAAITKPRSRAPTDVDAAKVQPLGPAEGPAEERARVPAAP